MSEKPKCNQGLIDFIDQHDMRPEWLIGEGADMKLRFDEIELHFTGAEEITIVYKYKGDTLFYQTSRRQLGETNFKICVNGFDATISTNITPPIPAN